MAQIPSKLNASSSAVSASGGRLIYITAIIKSGALTVDGVSLGTVGPINLSSPISCSTFNPASAGQVAYYEG